MATLDSVAQLTDQKQKIEQYRLLLNDILASGSRQKCQSFVDHSAFYMRPHLSLALHVPTLPGHDRSSDLVVLEESVQSAVLSDAVPLVISRQLLQAFTNEIKEKLSRDVHKDVATL